MKLHRILLGSVAFAGIVAPVIPQDMKFLYAQEIPCSVFVNATTGPISSSTPELHHVPYIPKTCDKVAAVATFRDSNGNEVYVDIPDTEYVSMGKEGGHSFNPVKDDYISLFEAMADTAQAAIATTSQALVTTSAGTSLTFSLDATGASTLAVAAFNQAAFAGDTQTVTYNAASLTKIATSSRSDNTLREISLWGIQSPTTGANNVVITRGTASLSLFGGAVAFSGTNSSTAIPTNPFTAPFNNDATTTQSTGTSITSKLQNGAGAAVAWAGVFDSGGQTVGSGATLISSSDIFSFGVSNPITSNANQNVAMNATSGTNAMVMGGFEKAAAAVAGYQLWSLSQF